MDAFSPDFSPFWNSTRDAADDRHVDPDERRSAGDEKALAELAERVLAARSIV
jgi:hypothetical protein